MLWTVREAIALLETWDPPAGIRFWLMYEPFSDQLVAVLIHGDCAECKRDWQIDPTKSLDAAWQFLDWMAARVLAEHADCEAIAEVVADVSPAVAALDQVGEQFDAWADAYVGVPSRRGPIAGGVEP